ncbi:MAG: hypothetical protein KA105_00050 [Caulobacter sp.]|nr:hypothetical protein [Caulobacter sp.]
MITIRQFVGSLLSELARARVLSDASSAHIAQRYLGHDILKAFPVPRMHLKDVEVELNFAVASMVQQVDPMQDDEVRRNVAARLTTFVRGLPETPDLAPHFQAESNLASRWNAGLPAFETKLMQALGKLPPQRSAQTTRLSILIENYIHGQAADPSASGLVSRLLGLFRPPTEGAGPLSDMIRENVGQVLAGVHAPDADSAALDDLLDLNVLIGADDLERLAPERLQRIKLTFTSADRKWIATDSGGQTTHVLTA